MDKVESNKIKNEPFIVIYTGVQELALASLKLQQPQGQIRQAVALLIR